MRSARYSHAAALVNDKVVIVGGFDSTADVLASEAFDPAAGAWSLGASLNVARSEHTFTVHSSGRLLVAGGKNGSTRLMSAEIYSTASAAFTPTASMQATRVAHTATMLATGKVLVVGGTGSTGTSIKTAELYGNP